MLNSLTTQYLFQTPDYHPFSVKEGCISGCVSGISPVFKLGHRVLVDIRIIQQDEALYCNVPDLLTHLFANIIGGAHSSPVKHYILGGLMGVPCAKYRWSKLVT